MDLSNKTIFKYWLIFFLAATAGGYILGALAGGIVGMTIGIEMGAHHADVEEIRKAVQIPGKVAGYMVVVPWSFLCYRWTVLRLARKKAAPPE